MSLDSDAGRGIGARERLARIEERATEAANNSRVAREHIAQLAREVSELAASMKALYDQTQAHFRDDREHFDGLGERVAALEAARGAQEATHASNRWWTTFIASASGVAVGAVGAAIGVLAFIGRHAP